VVTVDVAAVLQAANEMEGPVGICAWHDQHVDLVEDARPRWIRQLCRQRKGGFTPGRFVPVLLADDQHRRLAGLGEIAAVTRRGTRKNEQRNRPSFLRGSDDANPQIGRATGELIDECLQFLLAGEVRLAGLECRRRYIHVRIRIARGNARRLDVFL
jgi:hypothetical protein